MENNELESIFNRLDAMRKDKSDDVQTRRFHKKGFELVLVNYNHLSELYMVENRQTGQVFRFDDIYLAAKEIAELLQNFKKNTEEEHA